MTAQELAKAMMEMTFTKDETIFEQGAPWSMWSLPIEQTIFRMGNQWFVHIDVSLQGILCFFHHTIFGSGF